MIHKVNQRISSSLMTILIFFLFAVTELMVILSGARIYKRTVESSETRFETRSIVRYMTTRIRQADSKNQITLDTFGDSDALLIREELDGEIYYTRIYCYDGWLRELFCSERNLLFPEDGEKVLKLQSLSLTLADNGIHIQTCIPDGTSVSFFLHLRTNQEVMP